MVKAVCSSAVKKLAVLSLAVAVSSGAVANAQMSGKDAKKQLSEMSPLERLIMKTGDKSKWQMYTELSRKIEEKFEELMQQKERLGNLINMRNDVSLKRMQPSVAEEYGLKVYGQHGGQRVKSMPHIIGSALCY